MRKISVTRKQQAKCVPRYMPTYTYFRFEYIAKKKKRNILKSFFTHMHSSGSAAAQVQVDKNLPLLHSK